MNKYLYWYPIILSAIGILIHFLGTLKLFQLDVPHSNHLIMLIIDLLVVIGLLKRVFWGYWLGILLYIQQSIMQPYWAYQAFIYDNALFQLLVTSPLVITALIVLIFKKNLFIENK